MTDRGKVVTELTEIYDEAYDRWAHRPYIEDKLVTLIRDNIPEALALLREQEPVKPNTSCDGLPDEGGTWWYVCGNCNNAIDPDDAYCRHCGREVKWDEADRC